MYISYKQVKKKSREKKGEKRRKSAIDFFITI